MSYHATIRALIEKAQFYQAAALALAKVAVAEGETTETGAPKRRGRRQRSFTEDVAAATKKRIYMKAYNARRRAAKKPNGADHKETDG